MKLLLLTLLLTLAWVPWGEAGAEMIWTPGSPYPHKETFAEDCARHNGYTNGDLCVVMPKDCLAKLEAAMRAMEPYSVGPMQQIWKDTPKDAYIRLEQTPGFEPQMLVAIRLWYAAKRDCWTTP